MAACTKCGTATDADSDIVCAVCHCVVSANLKHRNLSNRNLRGVDLRNVDLSHANLAGVDLTGADLRGANLDGVNVEGAVLEEAKVDAVYRQFLTGRRLKGYLGAPAWQFEAQDVWVPTASQGRFQANGYPIKCPCCHGEVFVIETVLLETRGMVMMHLGPLCIDAHALVCTTCSRIEWFKSHPALRP